MRPLCLVTTAERPAWELRGPRQRVNLSVLTLCRRTLLPMERALPHLGPKTKEARGKQGAAWLSTHLCAVAGVAHGTRLLLRVHVHVVSTIHICERPLGGAVVEDLRVCVCEYRVSISVSEHVENGHPTSPLRVVIEEALKRFGLARGSHFPVRCASFMADIGRNGKKLVFTNPRRRRRRRGQYTILPSFWLKPKHSPWLCG